VGERKSRALSPSLERAQERKSTLLLARAQELLRSCALDFPFSLSLAPFSRPSRSRSLSPSRPFALTLSPSLSLALTLERSRVRESESERSHSSSRPFTPTLSPSLSPALSLSLWISRSLSHRRSVSYTPKHVVSPADFFCILLNWIHQTQKKFIKKS